MKKMFSPPLWKKKSTLKVFLIMRLTFFLCLLTVVTAYADSYAQSAKFTLNYKNTSIKQILSDISNRHKIEFFYSNDDFDVNSKVNISVKNGTIREVLDKIIPGQMRYKVVDNIVILSPAPKVARKIMAATAEQKGNTITGTVTDKTGAPIPGATVMVKGKNIGTATDVDGKFIIKNIPANVKLVFSFIGMKNQEVDYTGQSVLNVVLTDDKRKLDEVVVVAYGTQKKVAVTGAISSVGSKELMQSSSADLTNALAGKIAGLTAIQAGGGQPGMDDATLYLRGISTLNGSSPLVLIDGVPRDNMRTLDANEVESVSVLKDASATAVFGVRGANGVILITTKRGQEGKAQLNINLEQSFTSLTRQPAAISSADYCRLRNQALLNDGLPALYSDGTIAKYENPLLGLDPKDPNYANEAKLRKYIYPSHNYYNEFMRKYTPQTRVSVDVTGGTQKVSYFVNAGYLHQGGNLNTEPESQLGYDPSAKMDRYSFRSNLDYKITNSLSAFLNLGTYIEQVNQPNADIKGIFFQSQSILPITVGPTTIAGYGVAPGQVVSPDYDLQNPFELINRRGYQKQVRSNLNSSLGATWDLSKAITPGLSVKGMISYDSYSYTSMTAGKSERLYLADVNPNTDQLSYAVKTDTENPLSISKSAQASYKINIQGSLIYNRKFGKHDVGGFILGQRDYWEEPKGSSKVLIPYNVLGVSARASYAYDNRYFAEYDMGYNGSEQFAPSHRFGFFPAFSLGWVLTNEQFLKDNPVVTNLKLRASYGKVGNDKTESARFLYMDDNEIQGGGALSYLDKGQQFVQGLVGNPDVHWEVSWKRNAGVDFQFVKNLTGSFDYFIEHRSDILIDRHTVPIFQGVAISSIPKVNMGIVYNHGYEAELTYNLPVNNDLSFMFKGNYSYARNVVKFADNVPRDASYFIQNTETGLSIGQSMGYLIDWKDHGGYWISQEEIKTSGLKFGITPRVGDFKYIDLNGDGTIDTKDYGLMGYSTVVPRINYGFTFSTNYKAFDFMIFFQGVSEYTGEYAGQGVYENQVSGTFYDYTRNAWTLDRYLKGEKITYPALSTHMTSNHVPNDFFNMDRSFIRLKNIEVGYTLQKSGLRAIGISKLRVFVGGQNLCTWDHLKMGQLDPEADPGNSYGYPPTKMVNFGLNVTF